MAPDPSKRALVSLHAESVLRRATEETSGSLEERVATALARALVGRTEAAAAEAAAVQAEALAARAPAIVCDAASVRALAVANAGDLRSAVDLARRASMMSRTEALQEQETLANVVLARVRRLTGRPFLATRILSALTRFSAPEYAAWIAWELALASGADAAGSAPGASAGLTAALACARRGDAAGFDSAIGEVARAVAPLSGHAADVARARAAIEPDLPVDTTSELSRWRYGLESTIPFGLAGLGPPSDDDAVGWVLVRPGKPAARLLGPGVALAESRGARRLARTQRKQGRTDTALAVLALAPTGGLGDDPFFSATYGFAFSRNVHGGVLDVLIHRARQHLGDAGELTRDRGALVLSVRRPILLVDPRSNTPIDDRVLQLVAQRGGLTAKDTSRELNIPLRSAQAALEALIGTGACSRVRKGRSIEYRVDDTTFEEPTDQRR